jgi:hypothetical protein
MDLTASILNLAGAKSLSNQPLDGMDIVEHVGQGKADVPRTLFWRGRRGENTWRGVRDGNVKLVSRQDGNMRQDWLFDLVTDQPERNDLAASQRRELHRLQDLLQRWENEVRPTR